MKNSYTFILANKTRSVLYIGVTSDLKPRLIRHKNEKGIVFARKYKVTDLIYFEEFSGINQAMKHIEKFGIGTGN